MPARRRQPRTISPRVRRHSTAPRPGERARCHMATAEVTAVLLDARPVLWTRYRIAASAARCRSGLSMAAPTSGRSRRWKRGDVGSLNRLIPQPAYERLQIREDLDAALAHLREVRDKYWDHDWRREHRGDGRHPENELWDAVQGFLDLVHASRSGRPDT